MNGRAWFNFQLSAASAVVERYGGENVLRNSEEAFFLFHMGSGNGSQALMLARQEF